MRRTDDCRTRHDFGYLIWVAAVLGALGAEAGASKSPPLPLPVATPTEVPVTEPGAVDERAVAEEFLALEMAGWRKVNPSDKCWKDKKFQYVKARAYGGNTQDSGDTKVLLSDTDPAPKILSISRDPEDASIRVVRFEVQPQGRQPIREEFSFAVNRVNVDVLGRASLIAQPERLVFRKSCQP